MISGSNSDGTLMCVGKCCSIVYTYIVISSSLIKLDINECTSMPNICGLGTCSNNINGAFYECSCQNGAMLTGLNSNGTLTCVGR